MLSSDYRTAVQNGIETLYHYEKFNPDYLTTTLAEHKVHCSDPASLNDPWDCRPWFDEDALEDPTVLGNFMEWIFSFVPTRPVTEGELKATQAEMRRNPEYRRGILKRFSEGFWEMIPNRWRIYCLTPVPDSTLMWSHYADNHRGICLEFSTASRPLEPINPIFGAQQVNYLSDYPTWAPHTVAGHGAQILLTKSDDWSYEREYRVIGLCEGIDRPTSVDAMIVRGAFLVVPQGTITSVIAGCEADCERIAQTVRSADPGVKLKRAVRSPNRYRLQIVDCA